jgi:hypothetical protein
MKIVEKFVPKEPPINNSFSKGVWALAKEKRRTV